MNNSSLEAGVLGTGTFRHARKVKAFLSISGQKTELFIPGTLLFLLTEMHGISGSPKNPKDFCYLDLKDKVCEGRVPDIKILTSRSV